jgi:translocation and assembly module TamB
MSRPMKILRNAAIGMAALIAVVLIAAFFTVRTQWFRDFVREKIITATEEGTGGKVDLGSFDFDWSHLHATLTDFVIHGNEPAGSAPFVRAAKAELYLRLFTRLNPPFELAYLGVDQPQANILVFPDGTTNVPTPRRKKKSETTPLETVVDLAIGRFELTNGLVKFNSQQQPLDVKANNLRAQLWYNVVNRGYRGQLSLQPVYVASGRNTPVAITVALPLTLKSDSIEVRDGSLSTGASHLAINGSLEDLRNPRTSAHIYGRIAMADLKNLGDLPLTVNARNVPEALDLDANATMADNRIEVTGLRLAAGESSIEAAGILRDPDGKGALRFKSRLALGEIGRMAGIAARPEGRASVDGTASLDANNSYLVAGNITARDLSFNQGRQRISRINLSSGVRLDPHRLDLNDLRLAAFGGEYAGDA